jgi:hypothetical protein
MTARQPRRTRRRTSPGTNLPRPASGSPSDEAETTVREASVPAARVPRRQTRHRQHHVTTDYSHVHKDLITVLVIGLIVLGFIFGMSFFI